MWLLLNLTREPDGTLRTEPVKEIPKHDVDYLYSLFHFVGAYNVSKAAKDIAVRNGQSFKTLCDQITSSIIKMTLIMLYSKQIGVVSIMPYR